ncbi:MULTISPECIES: hypothetical protein [unclassified Caballeronia]|uniref:hypothetical protein n=1 Tax=unclassified Caballeronia TaxID=2646786 RepID=UPI002027C177|nr:MULTISPECIES: hypothetical protein [unclassified Caballeronia]
MHTKEFLLLAAVIYVGWRYQRSHSGCSAIDRVYASEAASFNSLVGTNFTNSLWDSASGQPSYMYGAVPTAVQGGLSVQANTGGSIFGHV